MDKSKLIYFIDDDFEDLELMQDICNSLGHRSKLFQSSDALSQAIENGIPAPDLFFIDVIMPMIDGFEIVSALKAHPGYAGTPILIHSSKCDEACISKCYELGANYFFKKAYNLQGLRTTLEHALSKDWPVYKAGREEFFFQY